MTRVFLLKRISICLGLLLLVAGFGACGKMAQTSTKSPEEHLQIAQRLIEKGNFEKALKHLNQALSLSPEDPDIHLNLGWLYLYTGKLEDAKSELEIVSRAKPDSAKTQYLKGAIYSHLDQQQDAVTYYLKALEQDTENTQLHFDTANSLVALNQYPEAIEHLKIGLDLTPQDNVGGRTNFLFALCSVHYKQKDFDQAYQYCEEAAEATPDPDEEDRIQDFIHQLKLVEELEKEPAGPEPTF